MPDVNHLKDPGHSVHSWLFFFEKKTYSAFSDRCARIHVSPIALGERIIMWQLFLQKELSDSVQKSLQGMHLSEGDAIY